jgi:DNA-binding NarL/FixJ family response regulator
MKAQSAETHFPCSAGWAKIAYHGRQKGTTKAPPQRAAILRQRGLTVLEIATALGVSERTVFRYLMAANA